MQCNDALRLIIVASILTAVRGAVARYFTEQWAMLSGRAERPRCTSIPRNLTLCYGMEYSQMRLPNLVEHETVDEVIQQAASWVPLIRLNCHPDAQLFLCGVFAPVCLNVDRAIPPCRNLCEQVRHACGRRMLAYGFPWPDMLACDRFPTTNDMCIQPRSSMQNVTCEFCNQVDTYENILDHFCRSDYVVKAKLADIKSSSMIIRRGRSLKVPRNEPMWRISSNGRRRRHVVRHQVVRFAEDGRKCPCDIGDHKTGRVQGSGAQRYLVMARRSQRGGYWVANMVLPWHKQKAFKRAVRQFRRIDCGALGRVIRDRARRRMPPKQPAGRRLSVHKEDEPWYRR